MAKKDITLDNQILIGFFLLIFPFILAFLATTPSLAKENQKELVPMQNGYIQEKIEKTDFIKETAGNKNFESRRINK